MGQISGGFKSEIWNLSLKIIIIVSAFVKLSIIRAVRFIQTIVFCGITELMLLYREKKAVKLDIHFHRKG